MDKTLFHFINYQISNGFFDAIMPIISNKFIWIPIYILFIVLAIKKFKSKAWLPILFIFFAYLVTEQTCNLVKHTFKRQRPNQIKELYAIKRIEGGSGYSTPSAHAANHLAIAIVASTILGFSSFGHFLILLWAIIIGFSRIYNGVHFPSDIFIGFAVGGFISIALLILYDYIFNRLWNKETA